jgi:hypothetical protein
VDTDVSPIVSAFQSGLAEQIIGMGPAAPERSYRQLFTLTATRLAQEKGWGREALVRISSAIDIGCGALLEENATRYRRSCSRTR